MNIIIAEARMMYYWNELSNHLELVGYDNFETVSPKKTVALVQPNLYPPKFKKAIQRPLDCQEVVKYDIEQYVDILCKEAKSFQ